MPDALPRLFADESGVWREDKPGFPSGIYWHEISGIGGYKLDGITEVYTVIELDHPSGHWIELHADWPGFGPVVDAITRKLPGIRPSWLEEINALEVRAPAITVWRRM